MKRCCLLLAAMALPFTLAVSALAQENPVAAPAANNSQVLGSVVKGNTTIVFEAANPSDIDAEHLQTWGAFAAAHPAIARALAYKPVLMNNASYLKKHPALNAFFETHPDIRSAMAENPGNFNAIPPRPGE